MKMLRSFKAIKFWKKLDVGFGETDVRQNNQQNDANDDPPYTFRGNRWVVQVTWVYWNSPFFSFQDLMFWVPPNRVCLKTDLLSKVMNIHFAL